MEREKQLIRQMEFKVVLFCALGLISAIFLFKTEIKYGLLAFLLLFAYGGFNVWQIEDKYQKGLYNFLVAECKSATESRDLVTQAPGAIRNVTGNKRKNYDFLFEIEDSENAQALVIKGGRDGVDYSVGMKYLLCFDISNSQILNNNNFVGSMPLSRTAAESDIPVNEQEILDEKPDMVIEIDTKEIRPINTANREEELAKKEILLQAIRNQK